MNELFWKIYLKYTFKDILIFLKNLISLIVYDIYICIYIYIFIIKVKIKVIILNNFFKDI